jgi:hypothetical protein
MFCMETGPHWKMVRNAVVQSLSGPGLQKLFSVVQSSAGMLLAKVSSLLDHGQLEIDIDDMMMVSNCTQWNAIGHGACAKS